VIALLNGSVAFDGPVAGYLASETAGRDG
jgi:hypothetical protein